MNSLATKWSPITKSFTRVSWAWLALHFACLALGNVPTTVAAEPAERRPTDPTPEQYGFFPPEIYKLDYRINNLLARDVDGDGKLDLVAVNNIKNRIDVLAQRSTPPADPKNDRKPNDLSYDRRLDHRKIQVRRPVSSLEAKDVNNDQRVDLVYLGEPKGLYIEYQQPDGSFGQERIFENQDAQTSTWCLEVADVNKDGLLDIAYLGTQYLYLHFQEPGGRLADAKKYRLGDEQAGLIRVIDLNEDGRNDIVYFSQSAELPIRIRFQDEDGSFGPERRLRIDPPRGVSFARFGDKSGEAVLSISSLTDRLMIYGLEFVQPTEDRPTSQAVVFPFDISGAGKSPDVVVADFDGDKKLDIVASDADSSQFQFFASARTSRSFPCLLGTEQIRAVDANGDGKSILLSMSTRDKSLAASQFADGRLTFPRPVGTLGDVVAMEVVGTGPAARLLYVAKESREVEGTKTDVHVLRRLKPAEGATELDWIADSMADKPEIDFKVDAKVLDLRSADVNQDGLLDLLVFQSFKPPAILLGEAGETYKAAADTGKGTLGNLTAADIYYGPISSGESAFLVTQDGHVRRLKMEATGQWTVIDQFNPTTGSAKLRGAVTLDLVGDNKPELAVYDRSSQSLIFLKDEAGLYRTWQSLKIGPFDVRGMRTGDFNQDGFTDILIFDNVKMAIVYTRGKDLVLTPLASYESDNKDATLFDMVPGDLNGDGALDILLLDPTDHNVEIVTRLGSGKLERMARWQVFEEKTFQRQAGSIEPREAIIADLDGDKLEDIALLVHDRVLVYRQDDGRQPPATTAKTP
jgi:hypothetical protein